MKLYLIRHGETYFNEVGRIQGHMDPGLNKEGRHQVEKIVSQLPSEPEFVLVSSPLRRARESAEILRDHFGFDEITVIPEFRELDQGYWNGLRGETAKKLEPERYENWQSSPLETRPPAGESLEEVRNRVKRGVMKLIDSVDRPVLVVAHKVVNSMILHLSGECRFDQVMQSLPENAAVFEISLERDFEETLS